MSNINHALIATYMHQLHLVANHQDLANEGKTNELAEMIDGLAMLAEAIGNANAVGLASVDEDSINVTATRNQLNNNSLGLDLDPYDDGSLNDIQ